MLKVANHRSPLDLYSSVLQRQTPPSSGHKMLTLFEYWGKRMLKADRSLPFIT